jgi:peptidoglycan/xylan/chitin deacetylase (PgdA/CDA1 family)
MGEIQGSSFLFRFARSAGSAAVIAMGLVASLASSGLASPPTASAPIEDTDVWLDALGGSWHRFDNPTRSDVAHVWGLLGYFGGISHLRGCVEDGEDTTGACHVALMSLQDVDSVPLLRKTLRHSDHHVAVGTAALGLAAFGDDFSRDLVLKALLETRGSWRATDALIRAFESMPGHWREMYLAFGAKILTDPMAASRAAAAAWPPSGPRDQRVISDALERFYAWWWRQDAPADEVNLTARDLAARISTDTEGCALADRIVLRLLASRRSKRSEHIAMIIGGLEEACFQSKASKWISKLGSHLDMAAFTDRLREAHKDLGDGVLWWKVTLQLVGQSAGIHLADEPAAVLAERLTAVESVLGLRTGQWDAFAARKLLIGARSWVPANHTELARRAKRDVFPEDFYGFNSFLDQPAWYPSQLHITIDDGPRLPYLPGILDTLERYRVRATFFFVGAALARRWLAHPEKTRALLERVKARGHRMAFHSMNHETVPSLHMREWEPEQVADSVDLYRLVLDKVAGSHVPITHGRLPGGMGFRWPWVKSSFYAAGLHEHVHWNAGPPTWIGATPTQEVRERACPIASRGKPTVILLHEYKALAQHLGAFLRTVREQCPLDNDAPIPEHTTAHWGTR